MIGYVLFLDQIFKNHAQNFRPCLLVHCQIQMWIEKRERKKLTTLKIFITFSITYPKLSSTSAFKLIAILASDPLPTRSIESKKPDLLILLSREETFFWFPISLSRVPVISLPLCSHALPAMVSQHSIWSRASTHTTSLVRTVFLVIDL